MRISDDDLRAIWQEESKPEPADCLTEDAWVRLLTREADPAERARAAGHIASCSACAGEYRLLQPVQAWEADVNRALSPHRLERLARWTGWRAWWSSPRLAFVAVAATLLLATQGVMLSQLIAGRREKARLETQLAANDERLSTSESSVVALQERLRTESAEKEQLDALQRQHQAQLSTPQLDAAIVDLEPRVAGVLRGSSEPQIVSAAANALAATLVLNFPPLPSRAMLEVEVSDATGQVRWTDRTQRERDTTALTLALPTTGYPPGAYVIRVFDATRGRIALATYPVVVRHTTERQQ